MRTTLSRRTGSTITAAALALCTAAAVGAPTVPTGAAVGNGCGYTHSLSDLNGDGFDDTVIGDPYATVSGKAEAGTITVLFGDADGRIGEGVRRVLTQASVGGSAVEAGDHFGGSVAIGHLLMRRCADLLIGSPGEDWNGHADAGIAQIITFTPDAEGGPGTAHGRVLTQANTGGSVEAGDQFGATAAISPDQSDTSAGAIGAPGEDAGSIKDAGAVNTVSFSYDNLVRVREQREGTAGVPGVPEAGDRFGSALMFAQLFAEPAEPGFEAVNAGLVVGAPGDVVSGHDNAGSVTYMNANECVNCGGKPLQYTQDSPDVPGSAEAGDQFGYSLASDSVDASTNEFIFHDVVVGSPGEDIGGIVDAGSITQFRSTSGGAWVARGSLSQADAKVPGSPETGDRFGHSLAFLNGRQASRLLVGSPYEDVGSVVDAGMVVALGPDGTLLEPVAYTENSPGTPGNVAAHDRFGLTLGSVTGVREDIGTISSPYHGVGSVFVLGYDDTRAWVPGQGGIPATGAGRFGWSLSSRNGF
jgi:hypothetical protein